MIQTMINNKIPKSLNPQNPHDSDNDRQNQRKSFNPSNQLIQTIISKIREILNPQNPRFRQ